MLAPTPPPTPVPSPSPSRAGSRLAERFADAEARGATLLDALRGRLQQLAIAQQHADLGVPLPGRLRVPRDASDDQAGSQGGAPSASSVPAPHKYAALLPALVFKLAKAAEEVLEQVRLCVEELEALSRQLERASHNVSDQERAYFCTQEFWRKRLLVEAASVADSPADVDQLRLAWVSKPT